MLDAVLKGLCVISTIGKETLFSYVEGQFDAIIYFVDSSTSERFLEANRQLHVRR